MLALPQTQAQTVSLVPDDCQIAAGNDLEAVTSWIKEARNPNTKKAYIKEARRLLLWSSQIANKTFSQLKKDDFADFFDFLQNPSPKWQNYCFEYTLMGKLHRSQPFKQGLSGSTLQSSIQVISSLMRFLLQAGYIRNNPMALLSTAKLVHRRVEQTYKTIERILNPKEWEAIQKTLQEWPEDSNSDRRFKSRMQMLLALLYFLGLRIEEVTGAAWDSFVDRGESKWFFVQGKGNKRSHLPVHPKLWECVQVYRQTLGSQTMQGEKDALLYSTHTHRALSYDSLYELVKRVCRKAAEEFPQDSQEYKRLQHCSPHWFRHLFASHLDQAGIPYTLIQRLLRHSQQDVTNIYIHDSDEQLQNAILKLNWNITPRQFVSEDLHTFKFSIKTKSGQVVLFEKFLSAMENLILKDFEYSLAVSRAELIEQFKRLSIRQLPLVVELKFKNGLSAESRRFIDESLKQSAGIRLLRYQKFQSKG